jgi:adenylyltransferase/sulfurtransferase
LILDGTDNAETRYLLNDVAVKHAIPWVYGACVGMEGRMMPIRPGVTPCLRCIFPTPPAAGELPTCDTTGVFAPAAAIVAALQAAAAIRFLLGADSAESLLTHFDAWTGRFRTASTADAKRPDCLTCGQKRFEFLEQVAGATSTSLCGRNAVQVRPAGGAVFDLEMLAGKLSAAGEVQRNAHLVRCVLPPPQSFRLTAFADGRLIVHGTSDIDRARSIYARYVGN